MYTQEDFLDFLFEDLEGYVYSPLYDRPTKRMEQKFFQWPGQRPELIEWIRESSKVGDVYIAPAIFKEASGEKKHFKDSRVVWAEYDGEELPRFDGIAEPDCIVQTSSVSHQHLYWRVSDRVVRDQLEGINRGISRLLGADSGWACNKLLRPPFTRNHKYPDRTTNLIHLQSGRPGRRSGDFPSFKGDLVASVVPKNLPTWEQILAGNDISAEIVDMVTTDVPVEGARSDFLMKLGHLAAEAGLEEKEIVSLLLKTDNRIGKFKGREDQFAQLADIATKAFAKEKEARGKSRILGFYETLALHEEFEWILQDWLHTQGGLILSSPPGVGKTQFCFQLALCLSTGSPFLDFQATKPMKVLFCSLEMESRNLGYIMGPQETLFTEKKGLIEENFGILPSDFEATTLTVEREIKLWRPRVIIIDSLSEIASDDLNETEGKRMMRWMRRIREQYDCAVVFIHHNRKSEGSRKPKKLDDLYGTFWFGKATETVIGLWQEDGIEEIEMNALKIRFGKKVDKRIVRDDATLTFSIKEARDDDSKPRDDSTVKGRLRF